MTLEDSPRAKAWLRQFELVDREVARQLLRSLRLISHSEFDRMAANGISPEAQDEIVQFITSFALYGFPESHSASFALLAYASAFLKVRYLAAFTCALLNNQPMGFYSPATIIKDAHWHGLRVKPVDVTGSDWNCTVENERGQFVVRFGLRYVRGLRQAVAERIVACRAQRPFASISDLTKRVPELSKSDLQMRARCCRNRIVYCCMLRNFMTKSS